MANPQSPAAQPSPPAKSAAPPQSASARSRGRAAVIVIGTVALVGALAIGLPALLGSGGSVETSAFPAIGEHDGREVAVVAFHRDGSGGPFQPMFQSRLAALDTGPERPPGMCASTTNS